MKIYTRRRGRVIPFIGDLTILRLRREGELQNGRERLFDNVLQQIRKVCGDANNCRMIK